MLIRRAGTGILVGVLSWAAIETVVEEDAPSAASSAFTDMPDSTIQAVKNLEIKHTPEKYYGASVEERFQAGGAPEIDYPVGPGTFYQSNK